MMLVKWSIEVYAESTLEAAMEARRIQLDVNSIATVFTVKDQGKLTTHDLTDAEMEGQPEV